MSLRLRIAAAFLAVYIIWGSTYLAIQFVIESIPPFFMAATRFLLAGAILYVWARFRGAAKENKRHWRSAFLIGGLMLLGGHGAVVWAEQWVPSSLVSLLIASVPLWMVFIDWIRGGSKPNLRVGAGLLLGFSGVALLVSELEGLGMNSVDFIGAIIVVFGAFLWANGSLHSRSAELPSSPLLGTSMEMIGGGALLLLASLLSGEWFRLRLDAVSVRSAVSWVYLVVFGSLIGFTCYIWLLKMATPAKASTYAYVNPIVAMFLGWALANETLTIRNLAAAIIILTSVVIITTHNPKGSSS